MGYRLDFGALLQYLSLFLQGTAVTVGLTAVAATLGIALSVGGAAASGRRAWARRLIGTYVELIRHRRPRTSGWDPARLRVQVSISCP